MRERSQIQTKARSARTMRVRARVDACAVSEALVANLLERSWGAMRAERGDDTGLWFAQIILCAAHVVTMGDTVLVGLDTIARCSGYSRRTLEYTFRQVSGDSPAGWLLKVRLYGALCELWEAEPGARVADVARRWGFPHVARFSGYFRSAFGELPSQTLRRAIGR
ncbi:MAG: AraC family transcriptional regulator [Proteobacteria bacterium]|nr:AraC family transcriptional regulator [Pseudomonadota bacterium]